MGRGNWYGDKAKGIRYTNIGRADKYQDINAMNPDFTWSSAWRSFDGLQGPRWMR
jgi:hypothetical protein